MFHIELICKCCGGEIAVLENSTYGKCVYCGTLITLPISRDSELISLHARANRLRMNCEFDRAIGVYEDILNKDEHDAEAHWGVLLSRYGIEYVEDPISKRRIPTCHRIQRTSLLIDPDYQAALDNAPDDETKQIYEAQAKEIFEIQQNYLMISGKEGPTDIFISYKDSTADGERTEDSLLAQDIYELLTGRGYHVFFSRISLENKPGIQFEPYIFSALATAQVMLVIGTCRENFDAVWVRNEWSRYIDQLDEEEVLIPCYKNMSVSELPQELSGFQSLDMNRVGFKQDLIHGIEKVLGSRQKRDGSANAHSINIKSLLRRAMLFLEDGEFVKADEYAERVLDESPECAQAYIVKFMASHQLCNEEDTEKQGIKIQDDTNFQKILRFGDDETKARFKGYLDVISERLKKEQERLEAERLKAEALEVERKAAEQRRAEYLEAKRKEKEKEDQRKKFEEDVADANTPYKPKTAPYETWSNGLIGHIRKATRNSNDYERGSELMKQANSAEAYERAIDAFNECGDYNDAQSLITKCQKKRTACMKLAICDDRMNTAETINDFARIVSVLWECKPHLDVDERIEYCQSKIDELNKNSPHREERPAKKKKRHFFRKFCLILLAIILVLIAVAILSHSNASAKYVTNENDYTYSMLSDGTIAITKYKGRDSHIEIPSELGGKTVTTIGNESFGYNYSLKSVIIPDTIVGIGEKAFHCCNQLNAVSLPQSLTEINKSAFAYCSKLESITIPSGVQIIGESAFEYCSNLKSITIPSGVQIIGERAFYWSGLKSAVISEGVQAIGERAFYYCDKLKTVSLPQSLTEINKSAFEYCSNLDGITIPSGVQIIGDNAFYRSGLKNAVISEGVQEIGEKAFYGCELENVVVPQSITVIGSSAFNSNYSLKTLQYAGTKSQWKKVKLGDNCLPSRVKVETK